jgi:hypothetical protein
MEMETWSQTWTQRHARRNKIKIWGISNTYVYSTYTVNIYAGVLHKKIKWKMEAQVIFLNPFTVGSSCKRNCMLDDEETNGSNSFANRLNALNGLNGLAHLR